MALNDWLRLCSVSPGGNANPLSQGRMQHLNRHPEGYCLLPEPVSSDNTSYFISCQSGGWRIKPGEVVNSFRHLPNAYPGNRTVAIISQSIQMVDVHGLPVPPTHVFVRHFYSDSLFLTGLVRP